MNEVAAKSILVAGGGPETKQAFQAICRQLALDVTFVDTAIDALLEVQRLKVDVVMLNYELPDVVNCLAIIRIIEAITERAAIVVMGAPTNAAEVAAAFDAGCEEYLRVPFSADDVRATIEKTFGPVRTPPSAGGPG